MEVAQDGCTQECFQGEACDDAVLPYCTVAWWVKAFWEGRDAIKTISVQDDPMWRTTQFNSLLPCSMLIADGLRVSWQQKSEYVTKLCSTFCMAFWFTTNLQCIGYPVKFLVQQWHCYAVAQALLDQWIVAMDETCDHSYEPNFKFRSNEWEHPGSPCPKKAHPTQNAVKMIIVAYDIDGLHHTVPPKQTVNAACYCTFLQHQLRPVLRNYDTWWYRTPSFFMTMQGVMPLFLSWIGLPYILIFPDMSSFARVILASGRNFQNWRKCPEIGLKHFNFLLSSDIRSEESIAIVNNFDFDYLWISILYQSLTLKKSFLGSVQR